eukprot:gene880-1103_t
MDKMIGLDQIVQNKNLALIFRKFLYERYNNENFSFWLEAENFKHLSQPNQINDRSKEMYEKYFSSTSKYELNVDHHQRKDLEERILNPSPEIFIQIQNTIRKLMEMDAIPLFVKSDCYKKYKESEHIDIDISERDRRLIVLTSLIFDVSAVIRTPFGRKRMEHRRSKMEKPQIQFTQNQTLWYNQYVDHFNPTNFATFQHQYQVVDDWFKGDGPIFVFLAGEAPMGFFTFQEVQIVNWAQQFNALYVVIEHRFYGDSNPTPDFTTPNLRYLTAQQAMGDAVTLIYALQAARGLIANKVVIFGCSYSAGLAAWVRSFYPNVVLAAVAPSGPVLAQTNFTGYYGQFSESASPGCVMAAQLATHQIIEYLETGSGTEQIGKIFKSCYPLESSEDIYYFLYSLTEALGGADQMDNPPTWQLNATCETLVSNGQFVQNWATIFNEGLGDGCNDFRLSTFIDAMKVTSNQAQTGDRSWMWQSCLEFGYFATSYPGTSVFFPSLNVEQQISWCSQVFGISGMTPRVQQTNEDYGGLNLDATNVMFTNGNLDPWHLLSINDYNAPTGVKGSNYQAGHCGSVIASTPNDPPSLTNTRAQVVEFLKDVLSQ